MISFKEWLNLAEQPHVFANAPVTFKLGGFTYQNIIAIDPRIERFTDPALRMKFFGFLVGNRVMGQQPGSIYFIDDLRNTFEITSMYELKQVKFTPPAERVMPQGWWHQAEFRDVNQKQIDNSMPAYSAQATADASL